MSHVHDASINAVVVPCDNNMDTSTRIDTKWFHSIVALPKASIDEPSSLIEAFNPPPTAINAVDRFTSISSTPSWCTSMKKNNESIQGERILNTGTTKKRRSVSLDDVSSPVAKQQKSHPSNRIRKHEYKYHDDYDVTETASNSTNPAYSSNSAVRVKLLSSPNDALVLSEFHVFVRRQIEVFTATEADIAQPAPGRKHRIQLHQVGLRCIHCRNLPARDRVKRAVCYPSGIARVYHSVSDMKFDHFAHCKGRSAEICAKFQELKAKCQQKRNKKSMVESDHPSSSSTAQYYQDSALEMGMVDGPGGLFMANAVISEVITPSETHILTTAQIENPTNFVSDSKIAASNLPISKGDDTTSKIESECIKKQNKSVSNNDNSSVPENSIVMSSLAYHLYNMNNSSGARSPKIMNNVRGVTIDDAVVKGTFDTSGSGHAMKTLGASGACLLTFATDSQYLNAIHCFVRRHIQLFVANREDIAAPAPGRKTRVVLGQVGVRCIHCAKQPMKDRVKRAVCYPATISGIYHAVSNMKFDHFHKCRALPQNERDIFLSLRTTCGRHGPRISTSNNNGADKATVSNSNSTAQYYHDSALSLGLYDTENGIRFQYSLLLPQHCPAVGLARPIANAQHVLSTTRCSMFLNDSKAIVNVNGMTDRANAQLLSSSSSLSSPNKAMDSNIAAAKNTHDGISALMMAASVRVATSTAVADEKTAKKSQMQTFATTQQRREAMV
jgi:hypothetical protein